MYFNRTSIGGFHRYFQQLPYFPRGSTQLDPHVDLVQVLCLMPFPDGALLIFRDQHFECDPWDWIPVSSLSQTGCILFASVNHYTTDRLLGFFFSLFLWICLRFETFTWLWVNFLKKKKSAEFVSSDIPCLTNSLHIIKKQNEIKFKTQHLQRKLKQMNPEPWPTYLHNLLKSYYFQKSFFYNL